MLRRSFLTLNKLFSTSYKHLIPGVKVYTQLESLNQHLKQQQAEFTVVYFRAGWNIECLEADKDVSRLKKEFPNVEVVAVDSDKSLELKRYYDIRYEPEIVLCLYGDEVTRHVGVDYDNLRSRLERVMRLPHTIDFEGLDKWMPFGTVSNAYYDYELREFLREQRQ